VTYSVDWPRGLRGLAVVAVVLIVTGCGGPYDASVTGVATLDGSPIPRGTVKYIPNGAGPSAYGLIEEDGSYTLMTGREDGLPSGSYTVTVVANEKSIPSANPSAPPTPGKPITPPWYRTESTSGLNVTVQPGSNEINLELSWQPPAGWNSRRHR
jgi:hypothetical protein